jgi:hypothetical protein
MSALGAFTMVTGCAEYWLRPTLVMAVLSSVVGVFLFFDIFTRIL